MPDAVFNETVAVGSSTALVRCNHNKQNLRWVVWQMSVEVNVPNSQAQVDSVRRNGRLVTSSFIVPNSAQGPPALVMDGSDNLEVLFSGMNAGETAIVTLFYEEVLIGQMPSQFGLV